MRAARGFTLIELLTVIIILGILAVTVAPRYFDMAEQAERETGRQALAEGVVHFNLAFMKYVVDHKQPPPDIAAMSGNGYLGLTGGKVKVGDYRFSYTATATTVTVTGERTATGGSWEPIKDGSGNPALRTFDWP